MHQNGLLDVNPWCIQLTTIEEQQSPYVNTFKLIRPHVYNSPNTLCHSFKENEKDILLNLVSQEKSKLLINPFCSGQNF